MHRTAVAFTAVAFVLTCTAVMAQHATDPSVEPFTEIQSYLFTLGIALEKHVVTTHDGYILQMQRMPQPANKSAPVVFMQHGILASSWCFVDNEPARASAIVLWRRGYDVWLGNNRGNIFSRNHTTFKPDSKQFWNFTFHEMGMHDVATQLRHVISATTRPTLSYVGWSQGSSQFLIALQGESDDAAFIKAHVNLFVALSPVAFMRHSKSPVLTLASQLKLGLGAYDIYPYGFLKGGWGEWTIEKLACVVSKGIICKLTVDSMCGTSPLDDKSAIYNITKHFPAGVSVKDLYHFEQLIDHGKDNQTEWFGQFDYGTAGNQRQYHQPTAPVYDLSRLSGVPFALFVGANDDLAAPADVDALIQQLPAGVVQFNKTFAEFSHLTWLAAGDNASYWLSDLLAVISQHSGAVSLPAEPQSH